MKMYFRHKIRTDEMGKDDGAPLAPKAALRDSIEKTRQALNDAYAGFDNATEIDLIDSYIYEINSLQKRYKHLTDLASAELFPEAVSSGQYAPISPLVSQILG